MQDTMHSDELFGLHLADRYSTEQMKKRTAARLPPRPRSLPLFDAASSMMKRLKIVMYAPHSVPAMSQLLNRE